MAMLSMPPMWKATQMLVPLASRRVSVVRRTACGVMTPANSVPTTVPRSQHWNTAAQSEALRNGVRGSMNFIFATARLIERLPSVLASLRTSGRGFTSTSRPTAMDRFRSDLRTLWLKVARRAATPSDRRIARQNNADHCGAMRKSNPTRPVRLPPDCWPCCLMSARRGV